MKISKMLLLAAGFGICVLSISGNAFADGSSTNDMKKKKIESSMMTEDAGMKKPMAEEMGNTMKTDMEEPMKAEMEDTMKKDMKKPMKSSKES